MTDIRPGWQTTEFYVTLAAKLAALIVALVNLSGGKPEDATALGQGAGAATVGIGAIVIFGVLGWSYIRSRTQLKVAALASKSA
jgi:hypothetical protein